MQKLIFKKHKYIGACDDTLCTCNGDIKKCTMSKTGRFNGAMCYIHVLNLLKDTGREEVFFMENNHFTKSKRVFVRQYKKVKIYGEYLLKNKIKYNDALREELKRNDIDIDVKVFQRKIKIFNLPYAFLDSCKFYSIHYIINLFGLSKTPMIYNYLSRKISDGIIINYNWFFLKESFDKMFNKKKERSLKNENRTNEQFIKEEY